jgi:O-antigen/teichoic acid export membrane protein
MIEYYYGKTKFIAVGSMLAAALNVILNNIFIPTYGYVAAAYTTMVTYFLYFTFHFILAVKIHGSGLFSAAQLFGICGGMVAMGFVAVMLQDQILIRWVLEVLIGLYSLYWAEKNFGIKNLIRAKLGG